MSDMFKRGYDAALAGAVDANRFAILCEDAIKDRVVADWFSTFASIAPREVTIAEALQALLPLFDRVRDWRSNLNGDGLEAVEEAHREATDVLQRLQAGMPR